MPSTNLNSIIHLLKFKQFSKELGSLQFGQNKGSVYVSVCKEKLKDCKFSICSPKKNKISNLLLKLHEFIKHLRQCPNAGVCAAAQTTVNWPQAVIRLCIYESLKGLGANALGIWLCLSKIQEFKYSPSDLADGMLPCARVCMLWCQENYPNG